jgi:hypothetical protein
MRRWIHGCGAIVALGVVLGACKEPSVPPVAAAHGAHDAATANVVTDQLEAVLREVRRLTQPYRSLAAAKAAGYNAQLTGCMVQAPDGGMGFHYGAPALIDGSVEPLKPEILMYEPQSNGDLLLVGVEYVVPYAAWSSDSPPSLVGVPFHRNDAFGLWVLHAWIWKRNPSGILMDWNPTVSCQFAAPTRN